jgi:hypothetical protein
MTTSTNLAFNSPGQRTVLSGRQRWLIGCVVGLLPACGPTNPTPAANSAVGDWGGEHVQLTVTTSNAIVQFDCAHGTLDKEVMPDSRGRFDVPGTFVREHGGPVRLGEVPDEHPARYAGVIDGKTMTFTGTITDQSQTIGPFTLVQGGQPRLTRCL